MRWVRRFWDEESIWFYFELNETGQVTRQIEFQDPGGAAVAAAALGEWFHELEAGRIQEYGATFGGIADQPINLDEIDDYEPVSEETFERLWREAREHLSGGTLGRES